MLSTEAFVLPKPHLGHLNLSFILAVHAVKMVPRVHLPFAIAYEEVAYRIFSGLPRHTIMDTPFGLGDLPPGRLPLALPRPNGGKRQRCQTV
jgi:hypothetical protein